MSEHLLPQPEGISTQPDWVQSQGHIEHFTHAVRSNLLNIGVTAVAFLGVNDMIAAPTTAQGNDGCVTTQVPNGSYTDCHFSGEPPTPESPPPPATAPEIAPAPTRPAPTPEQVAAFLKAFNTLVNSPNATAPKPKRPNKPPKPRRSEREKLAAQVNDLIADGRIKVQPLKGGLHQRDERSKSTPNRNLASALQGERSHTSSRCANAPKEGAYINTRILKFLRNLGQKTSFSITTIVGGCHKNKSKHYEGKGVDIGCPISPKKIGIAERIGRKLGIKRNGENCAEDAHLHFSLRR